MARERIIGVYGLIDPRTRLIRYVGQSDDVLRRVTAHRCPKQANTNCGKWLSGLSRRHFVVEFVVLERAVNKADLNDIEHWWVQYGRCLGWVLTNHTSGGDVTWQFDAKTRQKMSKASKGKPKTEAHRKAISQAHVGKAKTPEHQAQLCGLNSPMKRPEVRAKQALTLWAGNALKRAIKRRGW